MDPKLLRVSRSFRRSTRTRYPIALALLERGPGTLQQIADWTGLDPTRVRWALEGSDPRGYFRPSASLLSVGVADVRVGRGAPIFAITALGVEALEAARREPTFAVPRARGHAGALQV